MAAGQSADFGDNRSDCFGVAAVNAAAGGDNIAAHDLLLDLFKETKCVFAFIFFQSRNRGILHCRYFLRTGLLDLFLVRIGKGGFSRSFHFRLKILVSFHRREIPWLLGTCFSKLDDRVKNGLHFAMTVHNCAQHFFFAKLMCLGFDHQNGFFRTCDHEVEFCVRHLRGHRIEDIFPIDEADTGGTYRTQERDAGDCQSRRGANEGNDIWIVFHVMGQHGADNLRFVFEPAYEGWAQWPVDQTGSQSFFFTRTAFAFKKATRNLTGGKCFFLIVDGKREKIQSRLLGFFGNCRTKNLSATISDHNCAVSLTCDFSGFQYERTSAPHHFLAMYFKHFFSFQCRNDPMPSCQI